MTCCRELLGRANVPSPFNRLAASGYYDGPTEGFVQCSRCGCTYAFRMLEWDDEQDVRVFSLAPSTTLFDKIIEQFAAPGTQPGSVVLIPPLGDAQDPTWESMLAAPVECIAVARDLLREIIICRGVTAEDLASVGSWLRHLGLR